MALKSRRHIYETAFDCKVERQNDENVDLIDRIANHPILQLLNLRRRSRRRNSSSSSSGGSLRCRSSRPSSSNNNGSKTSPSSASAGHPSSLDQKQPGTFTPQGVRQSRFPARSVSTNQLSQQRLRPIGLSKSDDEILNRASDDSPEEEDYLDDYVEGSHTRDLANDLHSLHVTTDNSFSMVVPSPPPPPPPDVATCASASCWERRRPHPPEAATPPRRKPSPKVHKSSAQCTSSDTCYSIPFSASTTRPFSHSLSRFGSKVQPQRQCFRDPRIKALQREMSKSQGLPSGIALHPLKLQSPPGTAPLPIKFSKRTPLADRSPSSWFSPVRHKDPKELSKKSFLSEEEISRQVSLTDSLEVLLDSSSRTDLRSCLFPPSVSVKYSSTESVVTASALSSMESLRSSVSDGCKGTASNESAISSYKSSSMGSDSSLVARPFLNLNAPHRSLIQSAKFQILSPISDKSQEPSSDAGGFSQKNSPQDFLDVTCSSRQKTPVAPQTPAAAPTPRNIPDDFRNIHHILRGPLLEAQAGSDSGISTEYKHRQSSTATKASNQLELPFSDLPFDMPKLRRRLAAAKVSLSSSNSSISSGATSSDANVRLSLPSTVLTSLNPTISKLQMSSALSQTSSSNSSDWEIRSSAESSDDQGTPKNQPKLPGKSALALELGCSAMAAKGEKVDVEIPLAQQSWYHGGINRKEAEAVLRSHSEGSYLVRSIDASKKEFSLALKSARGFMHLRIRLHSKTGNFSLGRSERPLFPSVPHVVCHHSTFRIPIKGAEHMVLLHPVPSETL